MTATRSLAAPHGASALSKAEGSRPRAQAFSVTFRKVGGSLIVAVPKELARELSLRANQTAAASIKDGKLVLAPSSRMDWASYFAREIDPEIANWTLEREPAIDDRDVFEDGGK
jgi:antitoxin component of MazEF toxin-antitoxin module